jgi:hypothetical protein
VFDLARSILARVRDQIGDGNRKVYAELAPLFARLIACFGDAAGFDDVAFARLLDGLRPGQSALGGQDALREGFTAYRDAARETNSVRRAELMLFANGLIGLHEQTRLQPNIVAALDAPVDVPAAGGLLPGRSFVRDVWQHIATSAAMHLDLPDGSAISLGEDPNESLDARYPADLRAPTLPALRELIARFSAAHADHAALGATDWANLNQRMRFIIDLFRTSQQNARMFEQPFSVEQRTAHAAALATPSDPPPAHAAA